MNGLATVTEHEFTGERTRSLSVGLTPPDRSLLARHWVLDRRAGVRRAVDLFAAAAGLLVLAPLLVLAAAAVKLTSKGPLFYGHERLGQHGRAFRMLKFRSMFVDSDQQKSRLVAECMDAVSGVRFKLKKDPRITTVGRILRKFSIDELPQLFNVFVGDMTLIGPRPPVREEVCLYDARAMRRLEVPQGLTCWWQVKGRSDLSFEQQVALDLDYIDRATAVDQLKILLATVPAVLFGRGAY